MTLLTPEPPSLLLPDRDFSREEVHAFLRNDFQAFAERAFTTLVPGATFVPNWHIDALAFHLEYVQDGSIKHLIVNLPPRSLKSLLVSVAFPAWLLGLNPSERIICVSYNSELAIKLSNDFRALVNAPWYQRLFPGMRVSNTKNSETEVMTTKRGFRLATSVGGTLTGRGGNIIIVDDPLKPQDAMSDSKREAANEWFNNTLRSRLDDKRTGAIIVVMQRLHAEDLCGMLLQSGEGWDRLIFPAVAEEEETIPTGRNSEYLRRAGEVLHEEREPLQYLERLKKQIGPDIFAAQYQQNPVPPGGKMIKREWLRYYEKAPERTRGVDIIQSWDTAGKENPHNDWSVCTTFLVTKKDYYLLDVVRGRFDYPQLRDTASRLVEKYKPDFVLVEDSSSGTALGQELKTMQGMRSKIKAVAATGSKESRLYVEEGKFSAGLVHFPRHASFKQALEAELLAFPHVKHDDQVDSITQALAFDLSTSRFARYDWV